MVNKENEITTWNKQTARNNIISFSLAISNTITSRYQSLYAEICMTFSKQDLFLSNCDQHKLSSRLNLQAPFSKCLPSFSSVFIVFCFFALFFCLFCLSKLSTKEHRWDETGLRHSQCLISELLRRRHSSWRLKRKSLNVSALCKTEKRKFKQGIPRQCNKAHISASNNLAGSRFKILKKKQPTNISADKEKYS